MKYETLKDYQKGFVAVSPAFGAARIGLELSDLESVANVILNKLDHWYMQNENGTLSALVEAQECYGLDHDKTRAFLYFAHAVHQMDINPTSSIWHDIAREFMDTFAPYGAHEMSLDEWLVSYGPALSPEIRTTGTDLLARFSGYGGEA